MFSKSSNSALAGSGYIVLQTVRVINCIVLTAVAAASVGLMVVAKMPDAWTFFNDVSLAFVVSVCVFLIASEWGVPKNFIETNFPVLRQEDNGFVWLGFSMIMLGSHTIGRLTDDANARNPSFWRLCLGSGIVAIFLGFLNMLLTWLYGSKQTSARHVRFYGATSTDQSWPGDYSSRDSSIQIEEKTKRSRSLSFFGGSKKKQPTISAPMPHNNTDNLECGLDDYSCYDSNSKVQQSPIAPGVTRPDSTLHPIHKIPRYSLISRLSRF